MKKYTTIFLDIDNITYELHKHRYMHSYSIAMVEQILKKGLNSLQIFEVIALLGKKEDIGRKYLYKNRIDFMKQVSKQSIGFMKDNSSYLKYLLKHYSRRKEEVLIVSGNLSLIEAAKMAGLDTCYFNLFNPNTRNLQPDIIISKLEELRKYCEVKPKTKKEEIVETQDLDTNYHYYIDSCLIELLNENNITISNYDSDKEKFLEHEFEDGKLLAITTDLALAKFFKERGHTTYFINNHKNDCIDYVADYESSIEKLPKQLEKIIKNQM